MHTRIRSLYHLARADFLERVRRYSFLLTLLFAAGLAYGAYSGRITLEMGGYRGRFNSAWVGGMMTLVTTTFLTMTGFYISVKNTIQRDQQTRVGLVLATTPLTRTQYVIGKALSNFAVLSSMVAVLAAGAIVLQVTNPEGRGLDLAKLLLPFVWVALPAVAVTASVAVLFETLPVLRGGVGNVIYFFAWATYLGASGVAGLNDYLGFGFLMHRMTESLKHIDPAYTGEFTLQIGPTAHATKTFLWNGVDWTPQVILGRLQWLGAALLIAWLSALFFNRFDPARGRQRAGKSRGEAAPSAEHAPTGNLPAVQLTPLSRTPRSGAFGRTVASELRLMLRNLPWWWYAVATGLFIACLFVTNAQALPMLAGAAWIWPVLVWSQMGSREARNNTESLLFSCAHSLHRQLPAVWVAGVLVALASAGGVAIHMAIARNFPGLLALMAGAYLSPLSPWR